MKKELSSAGDYDKLQKLLHRSTPVAPQEVNDSKAVLPEDVPKERQDHHAKAIDNNYEVMKIPSEMLDTDGKKPEYTRVSVSSLLHTQ
jgi:hypothetical protein